MTLRSFRHRLATLLAVCVLSFLALPASAQSQFEPVIKVNDSGISAYEIEQRIRLLQVLGAPGNLEEEARERLIDERLQVQEALRTGQTFTPEAIEDGVAEFAGRANTDPDTFLAVLARGGVAAESFVDFVEAGVLWRNYVQRVIAPAIARQVEDDEIDDAIARIGTTGSVRVLLSEIIMPARNAQERAQAEARAARLKSVNGIQAFAAAARQYSASSSRGRGGRLDWLPLENLPPPVRVQILKLSPGGVTDPLRLPNAVAVFQVRGLEETPAAANDIAEVDYARFIVPGGPAEAARVADRIDTCDDLYGEARRLPEEYLARRTVAPSQVPGDIARELERLDPGEVSTRLRQGEAGVLVMLCSRNAVAADEVDRNAIRSQVVNQRVSALAQARLDELRVEAEILYLE